MTTADPEKPNDGLRTAPQCLRCEYPLLGLTDNRCPECGQPFDLSDPATFRSPPLPVPPARTVQEVLVLLGVSTALALMRHDEGELFYELIIDATLLFAIALYFAVTNDRYWLSPFLFFVGYNGIWWSSCWLEAARAGEKFFECRLIVFSLVIGSFGALCMAGMKAEVHSHRKRGERDSLLEFFGKIEGTIPRAWRRKRVTKDREG
jgi:hypothetical protein